MKLKEKLREDKEKKEKANKERLLLSGGENSKGGDASITALSRFSK